MAPFAKARTWAARPGMINRWQSIIANPIYQTITIDDRYRLLSANRCPIDNHTPESWNFAIDSTRSPLITIDYYWLSLLLGWSMKIIDFRYQSINCYQLSSIAIDCYRSSISSLNLSENTHTAASSRLRVKITCHVSLKRMRKFVKWWNHAFPHTELLTVKY